MTVLLAGCNAATVQAYVNLAVNIALQIAVLAGAPQSTATKVSADLAVVDKLITDIAAATAAAKPGKLAELDAVLNIAQADLHAILDAAQVHDPRIIAVATASIAIAITALESIRALAVKTTSAKVANVMRSAAPVPSVLMPKGTVSSPSQLKAQYNAVVAAYPGAHIN